MHRIKAKSQKFWTRNILEILAISEAARWYFHPTGFDSSQYSALAPKIFVEYVAWKNSEVANRLSKCHSDIHVRSELIYPCVGFVCVHYCAYGHQLMLQDITRRYPFMQTESSSFCRSQTQG